MKKYIITGFLLATFFSVWAVAIPCLAQEKFPTKAITFLAGFAPGGIADRCARPLADFGSKYLGNPVVVVNREGGGGSVALGELKNAKPDGYTIGLLNAGAIISAQMRKVPYHPVQDFDPIIQFTTLIYGIVVQADSPFKTLNDLIAYAKANPNKVTYSTAGAGTPQHLVMLRLAEEANVKLIHVPFGGGIPAITALLGGHVTCSAQTNTFKPFVDSGKLRLLASFMEKRLEGYEDAPTLGELGYNIVASGIFGIIGPRGLPKDRGQILHDCFRKGIETQGVIEALKRLDFPVLYRNSEDFKIVIRDIYESTGKILEKYGEDIKK